MGEAASDLSPALLAAYAECAASVRLLDKDRYLASLFMPAEARRHVLALLAFSAEIARVRDLVSDPLPGEVRLQWWRDLIQGAARGRAEASPVAHALTDTIIRFRLPAKAFTDLIDARIFDLYDDPMPSLNDLEGYCGETASALIQLSAIILFGGTDPGTAEAAGHAGVAYGVTGLLRALPFHAARGQIYLPLDVLQRHGVVIADITIGRTTPALLAALAELRGHVRRHLDQIKALNAAQPAATAPAFLQLALVEPMLARMEAHGYDPFRSAIDMPQWRKQLTLWWAARRFRPVAD